MGTDTRVYTLQDIFRAAIAGQKAVAVWRLPNTDTVQACVQLGKQFTTGQPQLETSPFGFFFCPFQTSRQNQNLFIKGDLYFDGDDLVTAADAPAQQLDSFLKLLQQEQQNDSWHPSADDENHTCQTEQGFIDAVTKAVAAIQAEEMEKVVLSRNNRIQLPDQFSPIAALKSMAAAYPRAFISLVSIPGVGTWMGASPEILVSINEQQVFHTMALAGTQTAVENVADAIWRQKEIEEQAMVERYILSCFKKLRLRDYNEVGPRTVIAGNLMHLRTDFKVNLRDVHFPTLGTDMLELLHPTSAVCGLPKEPALQFILAHEGYNRSYYSGYLGPVNGSNGTHLYVNLRCMELLEHEAILYAGAGITEASDPQKEWQETQHKMQTMREILSIFG
ncbi:isochorismate synthase [Pontibacter korlensis]|uniref:isochorismate synthase n=1 Tax=Pontibacter korlensis TaxID=400092 RepID=A0A0E3UZ92_9BACT|nr:isochorismate synthase [Pontibacter korlensis]AKD05116.1 chorismate-binding protein [Pontibacter korlensis]